MAADDAQRPVESGSDGGASVVRSEERLEVGTARHVVGRVRVAKRVVTEERTITVTVRREELVIEEQPLSREDHTDLDGLDRNPTDRPDAPVLELTLCEEQVRTEVVVVPRERVRVFVDRTTGSTQVTEQLAREVVDVVETDAAGRTL